MSLKKIFIIMEANMKKFLLLVIITVLLPINYLFAQNSVKYTFFITDPCDLTTYALDFNENTFFEGESFVVEPQNLSDLTSSLAIYQPLYDALVGSVFGLEDGALDNDIKMGIWLQQLECDSALIQDPTGNKEPLFMFWGVVVEENGVFYGFEDFFYLKNNKRAFLKIPNSGPFQNLLNILNIQYDDLTFVYFQNNQVVDQGISWDIQPDTTTLWLTHFSRFGGGKGTLSGVTGVEEIDIPTQYKLYQNYPNPFNPSTIIRYSIPESGMVSLKVYNALGVEVKTLITEYQPTGIYEVEFNSGSAYKGLSSGVYFYQLKVNNYVDTKKMILIK